METLSDIFSRYDRWLQPLATMVLVVLLSLSLAQTALFVWGEMNPEPFDTGVTPGNSDVVANRPGVDITSLDVFGRRQQVVAQTSVVADAPATRLNLELQGVFIATDPEESSAIVAERNKEGELFNLGDMLPGNAVLNAVFEDHILIDRGGRIEKLLFADAGSRQQLTGQPTAPATVAAAPAFPDSTRLQNIRERINARQQQLQPGVPTEAMGSAGSPLRDHIASYRDRLGTEPDAVLKEIGVSAVSTDEAKGYRLGSEVPAQALSQFGLQSGDVILSVNGTPVGNVANDQALIDQAMSAGRVRVEVQRAERRFFLTVPIP